MRDGVGAVALMSVVLACPGAAQAQGHGELGVGYALLAPVGSSGNANLPAGFYLSAGTAVGRS